MKDQLSRRTLMGGLLGGVFVSASGCAGFTGGGGGSEGSAGSGGGSTGGSLTVAWWGDADRAALYDEALGIFADGRDGLTLKTEFADLDPYLERLATTAAAGNLPDVMWMRDTHIGRYASAGSLLDLSEYLDSTIGVSDIGDAGVASGTVGDGVFALPTHYVGQALIVSNTRLADKGIDGAELSSWDQLAEAARELSDPENRQWGMNDVTLDSTHRHLEAYIRQAGQELFDEDGGLAVEPAILEEWFAYWDGLRSEGAIPPPDDQSEATGAGWSGDFIVTGNTALRLSSTNHYGIVSGLTEDDLGLLSIPALADGSDDWWFFPPILISVAANTSAPDDAAALLDFVINDKDAAAITRLSQGAPSSSSVRDSLTPSLEGPDAAFVEQISREMEQPSRPFPVRPEGAEQLNAALLRIGEEIAYGSSTVPDAVAQLVADANGYLGHA